MSSRQNRADKSALGPEDFMDEEVGQAVTGSLLVLPFPSPESLCKPSFLSEASLLRCYAHALCACQWLLHQSDVCAGDPGTVSEVRDVM